MAELEVDLPTGRVVGRFIVEVQDNTDPGEEPQLIPATGEVTIKSSIDHLEIYDPSLGDFITFRGPHRGVLDSEGRLSTPIPDFNEPMYTDMVLWANDSDKMSVKGWTYTATFNLKTLDGRALNLPAVTFELATGQEYNLARGLKVPSTPGYGLPQAEGAALRAEAAAIESKSSSQLSAQSAQQALTSAQAAQASAESMVVANDETMSLVAGDPESEFSSHLSAAIVDELSEQPAVVNAAEQAVNAIPEGIPARLTAIETKKCVRLEAGKWVWDTVAGTHYVIPDHTGALVIRATAVPVPAATPALNW